MVTDEDDEDLDDIEDENNGILYIIMS